MVALDQITELKNAFNSVTSLTKQLFLLMHPVGCIYMSTSSISPQTIFGGTWIRWGNGRVPVGVDTSDTSFNTVEKTGGNKKNTHHHLQTCSFDGDQAYMTATNTPSRVILAKRAVLNLSHIGEERTREDATYDTEIDLMNPYITCYMWKRTA